MTLVMLFLRGQAAESNGVIKFTGLFILLSLELSMSLHFCQEKISRLCVDLGTKSLQSFRTFFKSFELERLPNVQYPYEQEQ